MVAVPSSHRTTPPQPKRDDYCVSALVDLRSAIVFARQQLFTNYTTRLQGAHIVLGSNVRRTPRGGKEATCMLAPSVSYGLQRSGFLTAAYLALLAPALE